MEIRFAGGFESKRYCRPPRVLSPVVQPAVVGGVPGLRQRASRLVRQSSNNPLAADEGARAAPGARIHRLELWSGMGAGAQLSRHVAEILALVGMVETLLPGSYLRYVG